MEPARVQRLGYRFTFFDEPSTDVVAVFVIHYPSDASAIAEADLLLAHSVHSRVEVWQGSRQVYLKSLGVPAVPGGSLDPLRQTA